MGASIDEGKAGEDGYCSNERMDDEKKGSSSEMTIQKITAPIVLNSSISLEQYIARPDGDAIDTGNTYGIRSIVHHLGNTAYSGHYTADADRPSDGTEENWIHFDDGVATPANKERIVKSDRSQRTAYLLLYTL